MKRPMMALAVAWLSGIVAGRFGPPWCLWIFLVSYVIAILIFLKTVSHRPLILFPYVKQKRYVQMTLFFLMLPFLFCIGFSRQTLYEENVQEKLMPWQRLEEQEESQVFVIGTVTKKTTGKQVELTLSDCLVCGYKEREGGNGAESTGWKKAGDCQIIIEKEGERGISESRIGNRVSVYGKFYLYDTAGNPGQFDAAEYYHGKGVFASVRALRVDVISEESSVLGQGMFLLQSKLKETLSELYPTEKSGVLSAMLLGDKELLSADIKKLYQQNGISHLLAISGLHISMLCMGLFRLLRRIGVPLRLAALLTLLFLAFYVVFSGAATSSLRAGIMCVVLLAAKLFRRSYDLLSSLSLAAILVTTLRPQEITSAGFLLSFGAVLGVAVGQTVQEVLVESFRELFKECTDDSGRRAGGKRLFRWLRKSKQRKQMSKLLETAIGSLTFGTVIQLVTMPISLWFFYELSPYSIFLNLILIPLASFVLGGGVLSVLIGLFFPEAARLCAGGVYLILDFYEWIGELTQKLPYSFVLVGQPNVWQVVVYYVLFIVVVWRLVSLRGEKKGKKLIALMVCMVILFLPGKKSLEWSFLDVSQGDGVLLQTEDGTVLLFDGGSTDVSSVGTYRISPVLKQKGIALIDTVTISHLDSDHYSGVMELLEAMPVWEGREAFLRDYRGDIGICRLVLPKVKEPSEAYLELVVLAVGKGVELSYIEAGEALYEEKGLLIECLSPKDAVESENDTSLVFLIQTPELAVWMMGDAGVEAESAIIKRIGWDAGKVLSEKYNILKVGHHGSATSSSEEFLAFVQPDVAVISCGYKNSYGHPHESVLENLADVECVVYRTDLQGCIRLEADRYGKLRVWDWLPDRTEEKQK